MKGQIYYLVEWLWPYLVEVGWGAFIYVHSGAVLKRLPLSQMIVGVQSSYFPEVLLRVSGLAVTPILSVQSLWRVSMYALLQYSASHTDSNLIKLDYSLTFNLRSMLDLLYCEKTIPHCKASQLLQSQCWLQLEAQHRWSTLSQLYYQRCLARHHNPPKICKVWGIEETKSTQVLHLAKAIAIIQKVINLYCNVMQLLTVRIWQNT